MTTTTTALDLRDAVREVLDAGELHDPRQIASAVMASLPKSRYGEALAIALVNFVRQVITEERNKPTTQPVAGSSWKVRGIRDWWQSELDKKYPAAGEAGEWKPLRDLTYDEVLAVAEYRHEMARRNEAKALRFEGLARVMKAHGVATVGELSQDSVAHVFGVAA